MISVMGNLRGPVRLRTDKDAKSVAESFTGPTPPTLVFQWGIADEIRTGDEAVTYRLLYLFSLRSVEVAIDTRTDRTPDGGLRIELEVTVDGQPWSTYVTTVDTRDDWTVVEYEHTADRRFGLRRVLQRIVRTGTGTKRLNLKGTLSSSETNSTAPLSER